MLQPSPWQCLTGQLHQQPDLGWQTLQAADPEILAKYEALLSREEAEQLAAAPADALRRERLLARTLTRAVLGRYCHPICGRVCIAGQ